MTLDNITGSTFSGRRAGPYRHRGDALFTVETMGRRKFSSAILNLFGQAQGNMFPGSDLKAAREFGDEVYQVEVFNAPDGLLIALHELDVTHVLRPALHESGFNAGRQSYIIGQALLFAIDAIQHLPSEAQKWSDMRDMCALARALHGEYLVSEVFFLEIRTGREIDLWPDDEDRAAANEIRLSVDAAKKTFYEKHPGARPRGPKSDEVATSYGNRLSRSEPAGAASMALQQEIDGSEEAA